MVEGTRDIATKVRALVEAGEPVELEAETIAAAATDGATQALARFRARVVKSARSVIKMFAD